MLDEHARRISTAWSAADVSLGAETFGPLCRFFVSGAQRQAEVTKSTLDALRDATGHLACGVRDTAALYDRVDEANRTLFERSPQP